MKIITWNCQGAFRKKSDAIQELAPDILIVQECEYSDSLGFNGMDRFWFMSSKHKGVAIFSNGSFKFSLLENYNPKLKMIIPLEVSGGNFDFTLFAVWANNRDDPDGRYVTQMWKAVKYYDNQLANKKTMLIGDFNSNAIWDRKHRIDNHSNVVQMLGDKGIYSSYHLFFNQEQGKEFHPTLYMQRNRLKPYHIDYCFISEDMIQKLRSVEVGEHDFWKQYSDHVPLIVTLDL